MTSLKAAAGRLAGRRDLRALARDLPVLALAAVLAEALVILRVLGTRPDAYAALVERLGRPGPVVLNMVALTLLVGQAVAFLRSAARPVTADARRVAVPTFAIWLAVTAVAGWCLVRL